MKVFASLFILASACSAFSANHSPTTNAATRRDFFSGVASAAVAAGIVVAQPPAAVAKSTTTNLPPINGIYSDPNHKNGYRVVRAVDKTNAIVTLQDELKGPIISVNGKIKTNKKTGTTITLDFSPKGGPKGIVATLDGDKLFFPDGNSWTKSAGVDGIYADPNHPAGYRVVRISGSKMNITLQDEPKGDIIELQGRKKAGGYVVDFSPKGGPKNLTVQLKGGQLVFPDGNSWTKF